MTVNNIKKEILNNWSDNFSYLSVYAQNKLYKICGAFIMGIEILNLPRTEDYRPVFVCYPLWKTSIKQCLEEPIFIQEVYNKKGLQFNIPYNNHGIFLSEAVECTRKQVPILGAPEPSIKQLFETFNKQFSQTLIKSSPVGQAKLFEAKLLAAVYVNEDVIIEQAWKETYDTSKSWNPALFEWKYGKLDFWHQSLKEVIANRDRFLKQIEINRQDKKISHLKSSEITV